MESMWNTGLIKLFDKDHGTGIIEQYDGLELIFNQVDVLIPTSEEAPLHKGAKVFYHITKTDYGLQAKEITILTSGEV
ncbi:MAG: cold shock domain-containing protein [Chloroflexi bacterium]|nr:cold shock domain-containing protein [Chloroflexota bacterium]